MEKLKHIVEDTDTKAGRTFDLVIQALVVLSLITFMLETLPDLHTQTKRVLSVIEVITVMIFTAIILLLGLGFIAVPSGLIGSAFTKVHENHGHDKKD